VFRHPARVFRWLIWGPRCHAVLLLLLDPSISTRWLAVPSVQPQAFLTQKVNHLKSLFKLAPSYGWKCFGNTRRCSVPHTSVCLGGYVMTRSLDFFPKPCRRHFVLPFLILSSREHRGQPVFRATKPRFTPLPKPGLFQPIVLRWDPHCTARLFLGTGDLRASSMASLFFSRPHPAPYKFHWVFLKRSVDSIDPHTRALSPHAPRPPNHPVS